MKWFRFHSETRNNAKVQRLPAELFRVWVNLLCIASENGGVIPGTIDDIAFDLRLSPSKAARAVADLKAANLLDDDETLRPHDWSKWQYKSDDVATRVRRYRERQSNAACNVTETPPDTDTESEREKPDAIASVKKKGQPHGTRLPDDWQPDEQDRQFARNFGLDPGVIAPGFRDYWIAKPGADGRKLDWPATWRNWCRRAAADRASGSGRIVNRQGPPSLIAAARAVAARLESDQ